MGMLEDAVANDQPAATPAEQPVQQESMEAGQASPTSGEVTLPEKFEKLKDKAVSFMYDEKFDQLIKMFQQNGADGFARSVAVAINGAIAKVKETEQIDHKMATVIGMDLYLKVIEDMATGQMEGQPVVPGLTLEHIQAALPETIKMYAQSNPDVTDEMMQEMLQEIKNKQSGNTNGNA